MDKLGEMYDAWQKNAGDDPTLYQAFQGGVTASAVDMRKRAMAIVQEGVINKWPADRMINAIGALPDIPK